ncbi:YSIRK-type signal peptide-containing protein [Aerococcus urinae]|nr:YSIRK-type signal peptide-containing protein [Aerococcus urinae]
MLGKNNVKLYREKMANKFYRYSIKRLNIGVASVAVAVGLLFMGDAAVAQAAVNEAAAAETKVSLPSSQDQGLSSSQGQISPADLASSDKGQAVDKKATASQPVSPQENDNQPAALPLDENTPASPTAVSLPETPKAEVTSTSAPSNDLTSSSIEETTSLAPEETLATTYEAPENDQPPVVTDNQANSLRIENENLEGDKNGQRYQDYFGGQAEAGKTIKAVYIHDGVETPIGETVAESDGYWKIPLGAVKELRDGDKVRVTDGRTSKEVSVDSKFGAVISHSPQIVNEKGNGNLTLASKEFYIGFVDGIGKQLSAVGARVIVTYPDGDPEEKPQEIPINTAEDKVTVRIPKNHLPLKVLPGTQLNDYANSGIEITYVDRNGKPIVLNDFTRESVKRAYKNKERTFNVLDGLPLTNVPQIVDIYKISGTVYDDRNGDGSSTGDQTLSNIKVNLYNPDDGKLLASTTTDLNGRYTFEELPGYNSYVVKFEEPNRFSTVKAGKQFVGTEKIIKNLKKDEVVDTAFRKIKHYEVRTETDKHSSSVETTPLLPKGVRVVKQTGHDGVNRVIYEQTRDVLGDENLTEDNFTDYYTKKNSKELIKRQDEVILEGTGSALPDLAIDVQTKPGEKDGKKGTYVTFTYPKYDQEGNKTTETKTAFIPDGAKGDTGAQGPQGAPGEPGKDGGTPRLAIVKNEKKNPQEPNSYTIKITNPDGTSHQAVIADGKDGKSPEIDWVDNKDDTYTVKVKDVDGTTHSATIRNGKDGKTFAPVIKKDKNGVTTIKFYPVNPETGQPDTSQEAVAIGEIKDGERGPQGERGAQGPKGDKGDQGERGLQGATGAQGPKGDTGAQGAPGEKGKDGENGKSPSISTKDNGDGSYTLTITNPDGSTNSTVIKNGVDGKDGLEPTVTAKRNPDNNGVTLTITPRSRDEKGNIVSGTPQTVEIKDGAKGDRGLKGDTGAQGPQGPKGDKGDQGLPGEKGAKGDKGETGAQGAAGTNGKDGKNGADGKSPEISSAENADGSHTITIKNPNGTTTSFVVKNGQKGEAGAPGKDGKSPIVSAQRGFSDNTNKVPGTWLRIKNPETLETTNNIFIPDGAKGERGETGAQGPQGERGVAGDNGKSFIPVLTKDNNGTTTIKFYPVNPETGKADTSKEAVATGEIKDGAKGEAGAQGPQGEKGADGKSPEVSTTETKDGHTITIKNPDGSTTSFEVKNGQKGDQGERGLQGAAGADGKDGLAPKVTAVRNQANDGVTLTITPQSRDAQGKIVDGTPQSVDIKDGAKGEAGAQGLAGKDGLAPKVTAERNVANNGVTLTITPQIRDDKGNILDGKPQTVEVKDGQKGDDGKSFAPVLTKDKDGVTTIKFYPVNPETGKADTSKEAVATGEIKDGAKGEPGAQGPQGLKGDQGERGLQGERGEKGEAGAQGPQGEKGKDGVDGKSPEISTTENADGSHTITIKNPNGTTNSFTVKNGENGVAGTNGKDGKDAAPLTVTKTEKDKEGNTVVTLSDGTVLNIAKGDKGDQGLPGEKGAKGDKGDTGAQGPQGQKGDKGDRGETGAQGAAGANGKDGKNGLDGKSPEISSAENADGTHTITIKNPNGTTNSFVVKNGEKGAQGLKGEPGAQGPKGDKGDRGERGLQGERGAAGANGKTFAPVLTKDKDGVTTIKFYPVNPETGKADTTKEAVATGEIKDGAKGEVGAQGPQGEKGKDGADGKSPEISTTETPEGHTITIKNPNGTTTSFVVKNGEKGAKGEKGDTGAAGVNGKDGLAPKVTAVRNKANDGVTLTITPQSRDDKGNIVDGTPQIVDIKDGAQGEAGAQGLAGKDGLAPKVSADRNEANNGVTLTITPQIRDDKGNILDGKP